jgi:hypothetical protein
MPYGNKVKRMGPNVLLSDEMTMTGTSSVAITKNSVAISGCYLHALVITNVTATTAVLAAASRMTILDAGTALTTLQLGTTLNIPFQSTINLCGIPVSGALTVTGITGDAFKLRFLYSEF